jgi:iron complex transport system ATP-binding protein
MTRVAEGLSLSLGAGEFVCLIGPNGAGKSTLIRTLAGLQAPLSGQVRLMDDDILALTPQALAKRLSIVLTDRVEVGALSAHALVALGRYPYTNWMGRLSAHDHPICINHKRCVIALARMGIALRQRYKDSQL